MKPQKYTITYIKSEAKISKAGKPYTSVGMKLAEFGDQQWINGFGNKQTATWKEGSVVELIVTDEEYNGRVSKKFSIPDAADHVKMLEGRVWQLENDMALCMRSLAAANLLLKKATYPTQNNNPAAIDRAYEEQSALRAAAAAKAEADKKAAAQEALRKAQAAVAEYDSGEVTMDDFPNFADSSNGYGN